MKKLTAILGVLLFISLLSGVSPADCGQWVWVHGCAGSYNLKIFKNPVNLAIAPDATGMFINFSSDTPIGLTPTVCYAIPAINGGAIAANRVCIKFRGEPAGSPAVISAITVTNGEDIIFSRNDNLWGGFGYFEQSFDLGRTVVFDKGLCIAIGTTVTGAMSMMKIIAVGAYFNFNVQAGSNSPQ